MVINSNLGPVLPLYRDVTGFLLARATPRPFHPNFRGVILGLLVVTPRSEDPKLIIRLIIFEITQHIRLRHINVTDGERRTDGRLTIAIPRFALCASRGKRVTHSKLSCK